MKVYFHTFGCKANQYDTERMRQESEAYGAHTVRSYEGADVCVINTCTVTNQADADARRFIRRLRRESPDARIVVAGCSAALKAADYRSMEGVSAVVPGHAAEEVVGALGEVGRGVPGGLVQLETKTSFDRLNSEPVGAELLRTRAGATRGWLKIQDGCDRLCSFCATRLARGRSRSRPVEEIVAEARLLAEEHPELVLTGIHIGHYGRDLPSGVKRETLSSLVAVLLEALPGVRLRLGSVEATEIDDHLVELMEISRGQLAPHLHMPLQSGSDVVLRAMRRWHTREMYRSRVLEVVERIPELGLGADIITGFPGETDEHHRETADLVDELPFTYVHVFPFSPRDGTVAAELAQTQPVPQRVAGERGRELRLKVQDKGNQYRRSRVGGRATVTLERDGRTALTGDYLRVQIGARSVQSGLTDLRRLHTGWLQMTEGDLYIELSHTLDHDLKVETLESVRMA